MSWRKGKTLEAESPERRNGEKNFGKDFHYWAQVWEDMSALSFKTNMDFFFIFGEFFSIFGGKFLKIQIK